MSSTFGKKFLVVLFMPAELVFSVSLTVTFIDDGGSVRGLFQLSRSLARILFESSVRKITWYGLCLEDKMLCFILSVGHC